MKHTSGSSLELHRLEFREWWLSATAITVTLILTSGIAALAFAVSLQEEEFSAVQMKLAVRGLVGVVLLFDLYAIYQKLQIYRLRLDWNHREELFRLISENAADMIAVIDMDGRRLYNSPSYERILGYSAEELRATPPLEQVHPDDAETVLGAMNAAKHGSTMQIEYRMRHKQGHWVNLESTASVVRDEENLLRKLVIVNRDVSERKALQEQVSQAKRMEAIGRLSAGVANDFNNLLGVIAAYCEILQSKLLPENPLRDRVDQIAIAAARAAELTQQLLAFSRQQILVPKLLGLNQVVTTLEPILRHIAGEHIEVASILDPDLGQVLADEGQVEQILINLTNNARDAMPEGGRLSIETSNTTIDENCARDSLFGLVPGEFVRLRVRDTGKGFDPSSIPHIFEPFFTPNQTGKGIGLGLSMVYGTVKQSGGFLDVECCADGGTAFRIYLPRVASRYAA